MVAVIAFSLFIDYFLYGVLLPLASHSRAGLQTDTHMAYLYGAYAVSALLITPLFGYLGSRADGRSILLCGVALAVCSALVFALAPSFEFLVIARLLQGAASAGLWIAGLSLVAAHYVQKRTEMIGYVFTGSTVGSVLGPLSGGLLSHLGGYALPLLITALLLVVNAVLIIAIVPRQLGSRNEKLGTPGLALSKAMIGPALAIALAAFAVGVIEPLMPVRLARDGVTSKTTGLIFTISAVAYGLSAPVVDRISRRFSINRVMTAGAIAMAGALPLLAVFRQAGLVCLAVALVYISFAFMLNPASAELANVVDRTGRSSYSAAYALYNVVYSAGMLAMAAFAPAAANRVGFAGALLCISGILLLCVPLLVSVKSPDHTVLGVTQSEFKTS